ncbi:MAG TPA: glycosyltransferase family 2 protein [Allosphingosinicella sp.]|jgi:glycosyltransferase involved in cell wall biosynthesis
MHDPKWTHTLAIIVPCHNVEEKIAPLAECLLALADPSVEVVFVNDRSSDATLEVLAALKLRLKISCRIVDGSFFGPGGARNAGIRAASAKYVWMVDADDKIMPGPVLERFPLLQDEEIDVVSFRTKEFTDAGAEAPGPGTESMYSRYVAFGRFVDKVFLRKFLTENEIYFPEMCVSEDNFFTLVASDKVRKRVSFDELIYEIVPTEQSVTRGRFTSKYLSRWHVVAAMLEFVRRSPASPEELREFYREAVSLSIGRTWSYFVERGEYVRLALLLPRMVATLREMELLPYIGRFYEEGSAKNRLLKRAAIAAALPPSWLCGGAVGHIWSSQPGAELE